MKQNVDDWQLIYSILLISVLYGENGIHGTKGGVYLLTLDL